jgi:hypothetical protein
VCDQAIALWSIYMMWEIKSRPRSGVTLTGLELHPVLCGFELGDHPVRKQPMKNTRARSRQALTSLPVTKSFAH